LPAASYVCSVSLRCARSLLRPRVRRGATAISATDLILGPNVEPIPGYRLIERLGRGGFGEVWKAEAPGGLLKAIKFVYGDLETSGDADLAEQELKSLSRIKTIRHPYILSLERFEVVDGQLLIVMELADRNLWDRFRECRAQGLIGVPRAELLSYMREAAEALDLMNGQYNLQHLDIKPQNLFLVYNHIKVADFGLVKDFEGKRGTITGGITPVYAAPETFDGWVSRNSDQYSLAIVYQELLTGQRPFNGTLARQLVLQHMQAPPDVAPLPEADRPVIAKALSKKPDDRFATCADLIQALANAGTAPTPSATPSAVTMVLNNEAHANRDGESSGVVSGLATTADSPRALKNKRSSATQIGPRADSAQALDLPSIPSYETEDPGVLVPTVVLGLGGVGNQVLRLFRRALTERFGGQPLPHIRLLAIDTDPVALRALTQDENHPLAADELFHTGLGRPSRYLRGDQVAGIDTWLGNSTLYRLPKHPGAAELRAFGRLALLDHAASLARRLRAEIDACRKPDAMAEGERVSQYSARQVAPRVYVVAGLVGGTGGGMFIDAAYLVRAVLRQLDASSPHVVGLLMLPPCDRFLGNAPLANAHAALTELNHFSLPTTTYSAKFEPKQQAVNDPNPPFARVMLLPLADPSNESASQAAMGQASGWLLRELLTPVGPAAERHRDAFAAVRTTDKPSAQTAATFHFAWPRERAAKLAAQHLGRELVNRWMTKDAAHCRGAVSSWVEEQWEEHGLSPERLAGKLHDRVSAQLSKPATEQVERLIAPLAQAGPSDLTAEMFHDAFDRICLVMGPPDASFTKAPAGRVTPLFEKARPEVSRECDKLVAELITRAVEHPGMRIIGAEEAARQISDKAKQALASYESLTESLTADAAEEAKKFAHMIVSLDRQQLSAKKQRNATRAMLDLLRSFPKKHYQSMLAATLRDIYRGVLGSIPDYLQEMNLCRERPAETIKELDRRIASELDLDVALGPGRSLLPGGDKTASEFACRSVAELTEEELLAVDAAVHVQIDERFSGLVNFCIGNGPKPEHLADALEGTGTELFLNRLTNANPAELLMGYDYGDLISAAMRDSHPPLAAADCAVESMVTIVAAPATNAGKKVIDAANEASPAVAVVGCESKSEVVVYRELRHLPLHGLPHLGPVAKEAYQKALAEGSVLPHSRLDIVWEAVK
jgi:eukaryotic-like serine/threonine-protein kinase